MNQDEQPLLSDFLKELKAHKKGVFLEHTIHIFYNDWSVNPYYDDDYSERVSITTTKLRNLNDTDYRNYRVLWWDQSIYVQAYIEICVKKVEE